MPWFRAYDKIVTAFANTGEENEATLEFVKQCDQVFQFGTIWVEADVREEKGLGTLYKMVNFDTASRSGEPYEAVIRKYGIPNQSFPHCTRELKAQPIAALIRTMGWKRGQYHIAIGIRADEAGRRDAQADKHSIVYPLIDWWPYSKQDVNKFWSKQPFRLRLAGYQGNCKWCWKKSTRKLLTIMDENPSAFVFPDRMEKTYGMIGPEFAKGTAPGYKRTFFRKHLSVDDLRKLHATTEWTKPENDALVLDEEQGCIESCEVDFAEPCERGSDGNNSVEQSGSVASGAEEPRRDV